ncbi:hypothetical protein [Escherichia coli]|uniref:hypothetical protein n=1 Tax=Escherichia coli TaxID=562 RepID=UPI001FF61B6C|nr:hypothetical protein [Escherichia coli]
MSTEKITLTEEWQQITTGNETVFIQSRSGDFALCDSQSTPDDSTPFIVATEARILPPASTGITAKHLMLRVIPTARKRRTVMC